MLSDEENEYWTCKWCNDYAWEIVSWLDEREEELTKETE